MKRLFSLSAVVLLFGTVVVGCQNTAEGAKQDAATDTTAVKEAGDKAAVATQQAAQDAKEKAAKAAAETKAATDHAVTATEQAANRAAMATEKAADRTAAATKKEGKNASDALTLTPKVQGAINNDSELSSANNTVNVVSGNGMIALEGTVKTKALKERAGNVAQQAVKAAGSNDTVENSLKVQGQ
jgi:predicted small secreted protein